MIIKNMNLKMTRGDDDEFSFTLVDEETRESLLAEGDTMYFTVKRSIHTKNIELQKVITHFPEGEVIVEIDAEDTAEMDYAEYVYDVQWVRGINGKKKTIIKEKKFDLGGEVTYE